MKYLKMLFLIILIITFNSTVFALNLDVDSDLNGFADKNLLNKNETQNLKNPFFIKKELVETPEEQENLEVAEETETQSPINRPVDLVEERVENIEQREPEPEIIINGIISASNSRMALLISYQQEKHLLQIGETVDDYKLTAYQNGEATFIRNGRAIKVSY